MAVAIAFKVTGSNGNLGANGTVTVTSLTTSGPSMILIAASTGNNSASTVSSITVGGVAGAALAKRQVLTDGTSNAEVWKFWSSGALASVSVAVTFSNTAGCGVNVIVCEATGTDTNSIGNTGGANGSSGTSAASATCSATGSVMFGSSVNLGGGTEAAGTNTTLLDATNDAAGDFAAATNNSQATTSGNSYTITTTHTSGVWAVAVAEVKPAAPASGGGAPSLAPFNMVGPGRFSAGPKFQTKTFDTARTVALTGSSATTSAGTPIPVPQIPLVGTSITTSSGTVTPSSAVPLTAPQISTMSGNVTVGSDVTVSLTGSAATASSGTLTPNSTVPTVGSSATVSAGTVVATPTLALTGSAATASLGTVTPSSAVPLVGSAATTSAGTVTAVISRYPISISGRKMFDAQGLPFRIKGRTAWGIMGLTPTLRDAFLDDCVSHGFNTIECQIPTRAPEMNLRPTDSAGNLPFLHTLGGATWSGTLSWSGNTNAPDFTTPNSLYWASVDALFAACYARQIMVMPFFGYLGQGGGAAAEGWQDELDANIAVIGDAGLNTYGAFVANRYKAFPNIIYGTAGDTAGGFDAENDVTVGIQSVSGQASGPQFTSQRQGGSISTDGATVLGASTTINGAYAWDTPTTQCQRAYSASSSIPGFLIEEPYEDEGTAGTGDNPTFSNTPPAMRRYEWWGWLNAIGGYVAGNGYVWRFALSGTPPSTDDYRNHLNTRNTQDLAQLNAFMERWPNTNVLIPGGLGGMRSLVVSGAGTIDTDQFVCAAQTADGTLLIGYTPPSASGTFSVDLRSMASRPLKAYWVDPTDSSTHTSATAANTFTLSNSASAQSFTIPAGTNSVGDTDWVLVLEAGTAYGTPPRDAFRMVGPGRFAHGPRPSLPGGFASAQATNVTVALTGSSATASAGTLTPAESIALAGSAATTVAGTLAPAASVALAGSAATTAAGTLTPASAVPLVGRSATTTPGTLTPAGSIAVVGASTTSAAGTLAPSESAPLAGTQATVTAGNVTAPSGSALTGSAATTGAGTTTPSASVTMVGSAASSAAGTIAPAVTVALAGSAATVSRGSLTPAGAAALSGGAATGSAGLLTPSAAIPLAGRSATTAAGTVTASGGAGDVTVALTGAAMTVILGVMVASRVTEPRRPPFVRYPVTPAPTRPPRRYVPPRTPRK